MRCSLEKSLHSGAIKCFYFAIDSLKVKVKNVSWAHLEFTIGKTNGICYIGIPLTKLSEKLKSRKKFGAKLNSVYSVVDYCTPVWYRSSHYWSGLDTQLNIVMRTITDTVDSTPIPWLYVLSNIASSQPRRKTAACRSMQRVHQLTTKLLTFNCW